MLFTQSVTPYELPMSSGERENPYEYPGAKTTSRPQASSANSSSPMVKFDTRSTRFGQQVDPPSTNTHFRNISPKSIPHLLELPSLLKSTSQKRERVVGAQIDVTGLRKNLSYQQRHTRTCQQNFQTAAEVLVKQLEALGIDLHSFDSFATLCQALERLQKSNGRWALYEEQLLEGESTLTVLQGELKDDEVKLYEKAESIISHITPGQDFGHQEERDVSSSPSSSTVIVDPLERDYYEQARTLSILRERLHQFQADHRENVQRRRDVEMLNGLAPSPDRALLKNYFQDLLSLYRQVRLTKEEVKNLRTRCLKAGIEVEDADVDFEDSDALEAPLDIERQLIHYASINNNVDDLDLPEHLFFGYKDEAARVDSWLTEVSQNLQDTDQKDIVEPDLLDSAPLDTTHVELREDLITKEPPQVYSRSTLIESSTNEEIPASHASSFVGGASKIKPQGEPPKRRYSEAFLRPLMVETVPKELSQARRPSSIR